MEKQRGPKRGHDAVIFLGNILLLQSAAAAVMLIMATLRPPWAHDALHPSVRDWGVHALENGLG